MQISKNSMMLRSYQFHRKLSLNRYEFDANPSDLCSFVRTYFWFLLRNSFAAFLLAFALTSGLSSGVLLIFNKLDAIDGIPFFMFGVGALTVTGICATGILGAFAILGGFEYLSDKLRNRSESAESCTPNILVEYLKAKKRKYCPRITYVD